MGNGSFEDRTESAGLTKQLGGKNLVQTDFNNDGQPACHADWDRDGDVDIFACIVTYCYASGWLTARTRRSLEQGMASEQAWRASAVLT